MSNRYPDYHGGPYDRGAADSWYRRDKDPHCWPRGTGHGERVEADELSPLQLEAYHAGYDENEANNTHKED